jgi:hypothetical protein
LVPPTSSENAELYKKDFYSWARETADLLRHGRLEEIDIHNLAEEIDDLGDEKRNKLVGLLGQSFAHLIKREYLSSTYPDNVARWRKDTEIFFKEGMRVLRKNPGLKGEFSEILEESWEMARGEVYRAFDEFTREKDLDKYGIPEHCPWSEDQILSGTFVPEPPPEFELPELS